MSVKSKPGAVTLSSAGAGAGSAGGRGAGRRGTRAGGPGAPARAAAGSWGPSSSA